MQVYDRNDFVDIDENGNVIRETALDKVKNFGKNVVDFCKNHPTEATAIFSVTVSVLLEGVKMNNRRLERYRSERKLYDKSEGHYVKLKRPLTGQEWCEYGKRRQADDTKNASQILNDMNLLKK